MSLMSLSEVGCCRKEVDALLPLPHSVCYGVQVSVQTVLEGIFVSCILLSYWVPVGAGQLVEP